MVVKLATWKSLAPNDKLISADKELQRLLQAGGSIVAAQTNKNTAEALDVMTEVNQGLAENRGYLKQLASKSEGFRQFARAHLLRASNDSG